MTYRDNLHTETQHPEAHTTQRQQHTQTQTHGPTQSSLFCSQPHWAGPRGSSKLRMGRGGPPHLSARPDRFHETHGWHHLPCETHVGQLDPGLARTPGFWGKRDWEPGLGSAGRGPGGLDSQVLRAGGLESWVLQKGGARYLCSSFFEVAF